MNQKTKKISLLDFQLDAQEGYLWGAAQGKLSFFKLVEAIDAAPSYSEFNISFNGIKATDVSFARESVLKIAKLSRGEKWIVLSDIVSTDLLDNLAYAAEKIKQPVRIIRDAECFFIGPEITHDKEWLIQFVFDHKSVTTSKVCSKLDLTAPNASAKLKKLANDGYFVRRQVAAESGGKEFEYSIAMN